MDPGFFLLWLYNYSDTRWLLCTQVWCQVALWYRHPLHCDLHPADSSSRWSGSWLPHRCQGVGRHWGGNLKTHYLQYGFSTSVIVVWKTMFHCCHRLYKCYSFWKIKALKSHSWASRECHILLCMRCGHHGHHLWREVDCSQSLTQVPCFDF